MFRFISTSNQNDSISLKLGSSYYCNIYNILETPKAAVVVPWRVMPWTHSFYLAVYIIV